MDGAGRDLSGIRRAGLWDVCYTPPMRAIVLTFDHLPRRLLGCYGNTWIETPRFDRLAAGSVVFDACFAADLTVAVREYCGEASAASTANSPWSATWRLSARSGPPGLLGRLQAAGVRTVLISETGSSHAAAPRFDEVREVRGDDSPDAALSERPFARLAAAGVECLRSLAPNRPSLIWLASRGVPSPWQPPREIAGVYWEEFFDAEPLRQTLAAALGDDPAGLPGQDASDPEQFLARAIDRLPAAGLLRRGPAPELEEFQALNCLTYAACVSTIDAASGALFEALAPGADDLLFIVAGAAGDLLSEHPCVMRGCPPIVDALAHVPLIVKAGAGEAGGSRRGELVSTVDLAATLAEWFGCGEPPGGDVGSLLPVVRGEASSAREEVFFEAAPIGWGVRTGEFSCLWGAMDGDGGPPSPGRAWLFRKPDDAADMLDVADQYPAECESLAEKWCARSQPRPPQGRAGGA